MHFLSFASKIPSLLVVPGVFGASVPSKHARSTSCTHSASNRACWSDGMDISTNYYDNVPNTGVTREYWFNIENTTAAPDGFEMPVQLINGSFPGPTIIADWGDEVGMQVSTFPGDPRLINLQSSTSRTLFNQTAQACTFMGFARTTQIRMTVFPV